MSDHRRGPDLSGHVALVTGASSGLGRRFATVLAARGAAVAVTARRAERLAELATEIESAGGRALPITLDVTDADALVEAVDRAQAELGVVDILVNNAGVPDAQFATKLPLALVDAVLDTNLRAPFLLAREVAARLIAADQPRRIVNVSSIGAFVYRGEGAALYSTTKGAINRLTETSPSSGHASASTSMPSPRERSRRR